MNTSTPPSPDEKLWKCPRGHILGRVVRRNRMHTLELFRYAVTDINDGQYLTTTIIADDVECSICGRRRTFYLLQDGYKHLFRRRNNPIKQKEELSCTTAF